MPFSFHLICLAYWFVVGAVVGSFLNVCIYRIPKKESVVKGSSHCTSCGEKIRKRDLVPIASYFILRGRCRACKSPFTIRYAFVEFLTGAVFVLAALKFKYTPETILMSLFFSALIVMTFIDVDTMTIPDSIHVVILIIGIVLAFVSDMPLLERIIGFFSVSFILFLASVLSKGGIGGGDIKLMAVSGFVLGYNFAEQWERALETDPPYVFVTGWNEWIAGRWQGTPERPLNFVDCADIEFSRDIEPMKGGYFDNYYMQLIYYVRKYKGTQPIIKQEEMETASVADCFARFNRSKVVYRDFPKGAMSRNCKGYDTVYTINFTEIGSYDNFYEENK
jgi:leader peptidase (prepilin peptidase)/N-methyltransferase